LKPIRLLVVLALTGCAAIPQGDYQSINMWVHENITPSTVDGEEFQTASETLERGAGDCEDFSYLFLWLAHEMYGVYGNMIVYRTERDTLHAIAEIGLVYYDPTWGVHYTTRPTDIVFEWGYIETTWYMWVFENDLQTE